MKITKNQLTKIIKEELMRESDFKAMFGMMDKEAAQAAFEFGKLFAGQPHIAKAVADAMGNNYPESVAQLMRGSEEGQKQMDVSLGDHWNDTFDQ